ncbi:MAG: transglutaminase domain-containing protein [Phycisphaerales bacterium]|jgi:transglutaminase-like putative cysteine protease|nr:transglutaminase domain-containing protein [Phycisphaerales bacterium]
MIIPSLLALAVLSQPAPAEPPLIQPQGPLQRGESVRHRMTITTTINYPPSSGQGQAWTMPIIVTGPWSTLDATGFAVALKAGRDTVNIDAVESLEGPGDLGGGELRIDVPPVQTWPLQVQVTATATVWSSVFDDAEAMATPWPATWPAAVTSLLKAGPLIESDAEVITATVEALTKGNVRSVPPAQAAKLIVRDACNRFKVVDTSDSRMSLGPQGQVRGIGVQGARKAAESGTGSPADLVCICVAMLRAAGLPARPVIGLGSAGYGRLTEYGVWAEVYLPECGWTPFDPDVLRQQALGTLDPRNAWTGFGTLRQLQRRIPLAWSFGPLKVATAYDAWAPWGWGRFLPAANFPVEIVNGTVDTPSGPFTLDPQRPIPSSIRLERTGAP